MTYQKNHQETPQEGKAVIYTRPGKSQAAPEMHPQQATDLLMLAREHGFRDVTLFADGYKPGSADTLEREMLQALLQSITTPEEGTAPIRAVFIGSEDRLFRDAESVDLATFVEVFRQHGVLLITPLGEYDFRNPVHAQLFQFKVQEAYQFVTQMVTTRLQAGRRAARLKRLQAPEPPPHTGTWTYPGRKATDTKEGN